MPSTGTATATSISRILSDIRRILLAIGKATPNPANAREQSGESHFLNDFLNSADEAVS